MRRIVIQDCEVLKIGIQQEILRTEDSRYYHRLHALLLLCNNISATQVANLLGQGRRTIQYWLERFRKDGLRGLYDVDRIGRPSILNESHLKQLGKDLRRKPSDFGYAHNMWDGKSLSHHLKKRFNVDLKVRQCQRLFHKLEFRQRKPRPVIAHADPAAQDAFKKTSDDNR